MFQRLLPALLSGLLLATSSCVLVASDSDSSSTSRPSRSTYNKEGRSDDLPFSHLVRTGDTYYVAGTLGLDPATGQAPEDVEDEVRFLLDDFAAKLALAGLEMDDLVSVQIFCPELELYETFNRVYATYFEDRYPVRSFLGSGPLLRGCHFEMNGIAVRSRN